MEALQTPVPRLDLAMASRLGRKRKHSVLEDDQDNSANEVVTGVAAFKRPAVKNSPKPPPREKKLTIEEAKNDTSGMYMIVTNYNLKFHVHRTCV